LSPSLTLSLPLAVAWIAAALLAPFDGRRRIAGWLALGGLAGCLAADLHLAVAVAHGRVSTVVAGGWPESVGITLRADPLGVLFAVLATALLVAALLHEVLGGVRERAFPALVLFLAAGLNGLFLTGDAFNFYVFFELSMTAAFVLASYGQETRQIRDALTFTVVNLLGSMVLLSALAGLYHVTGTLGMRAIAAQVARSDEPGSVLLIATLFFVAFGLKLGLFPFHAWLPAVYSGTHPAVAAILSGVIANIGGYGLLRFGGEMLAPELRLGSPVLLWLGVASILYGGIVAVSRRDASEVLAYSSISQAGYILIGLGLGGPAGYAAAVLYAVLNSLNKTLLFLAAGLRGAWVGLAFVIGALSVAGVPPAAGFLGKAGLFRAGLAAGHGGLVAVVFAGGALSFLYMFQVYQRDHWMPSNGEPRRAGPRLVVLALALGVLLLGFWPELLLRASQRAAGVLVGGRP
jgi:multicomponent Na+:H+ antiporter subunit D